MRGLFSSSSSSARNQPSASQSDRRPNMKYLITGATGNIGGRVVDRLLERGERPRVLVRDPEKARERFGDRADISVGDLSKAASLALAFAGVEAVLLINTGVELGARDAAVAKVAKAAG